MLIFTKNNMYLHKITDNGLLYNIGARNQFLRVLNSLIIDIRKVNIIYGSDVIFQWGGKQF